MRKIKSLRKTVEVLSKKEKKMLKPVPQQLFDRLKGFGKPSGEYPKVISSVFLKKLKLLFDLFKMLL
jgi:hypothetical protein